jgi:hypothetical protein
MKSKSRQWLLIPLFGIAVWLAWIWANDPKPHMMNWTLFCETIALLTICHLFAGRDSN